MAPSSNASVPSWVVARWPHGWQCAHCGCKRSFLTCNGQGRQLWECFICGYQSSSIVGTVMEHTHLPLRVWFLAMYLMTQNKNAISALALKRQLGVSCKSAWRLLHKLMQTMGVRDARYRLQLGTVCLDGTKIHANASRHSALSHGHIVKLEAQLRQEVQELLALAEDADTANIPDGMSLPQERQLREDRLAAMAAAKAKIAARAAQRYAREKAEFDEKMRKREAKQKETGKKPGGKPPTAPEPGAKDSDQINLTDEESRIMPLSGGGFEQCYNAQAGADAQPMLKVLQEQSAKLGTVTPLIAETGYCSEKNVVACDEAKIVPLIAVARQDHHPHWSERFTELAPLKAGATPMQAMTHRLTTLAGRADYAIRKQTLEPVFGIIKSVMGFRQFSLRGLRKVTGEWNLVCLAWNVKRMAVLRPKIG